MVIRNLTYRKKKKFSCSCTDGLPWFQDGRPAQPCWDVLVYRELAEDLRQVLAGPLWLALQSQPCRVWPAGEQCRDRPRHHLPVEEATRERPLFQQHRGHAVPRQVRLPYLYAFLLLPVLCERNDRHYVFVISKNSLTGNRLSLIKANGIPCLLRGSLRKPEV
jgi:hypothetical protein